MPSGVHNVPKLQLTRANRVATRPCAYSPGPTPACPSQTHFREHHFPRWSPPWLATVPSGRPRACPPRRQQPRHWRPGSGRTGGGKRLRTRTGSSSDWRPETLRRPLRHAASPPLLPLPKPSPSSRRSCKVTCPDRKPPPARRPTFSRPAIRACPCDLHRHRRTLPALQARPWACRRLPASTTVASRRLTAPLRRSLRARSTKGPRPCGTSTVRSAGVAMPGPPCGRRRRLR